MATDKKLSQVPNLTDFDYALIVKGEQVSKISKADLASVVAGLMSNNSLFPFGVYSSATAVDDIKKSGIYSYNDESMNGPVGYTWGMLVHFQNPLGWGTFQLAIPNLGKNDFYYRVKGNGWNPWVKINTL